MSASDVDRDGTVIMLRHRVKILEYEVRQARQWYDYLKREYDALEQRNVELRMKLDEREDNGSDGND